MDQQPDHAPAAGSWPSLAVLAAIGAALLGVAAWHLAAVVLSVAPPNPVSDRYRTLIHGYVDPEFVQNWKLFAPDPPQETIRVEARVRTAGSTGTRRTSQWIDLTAADLAALSGSLLPGIVHNSLLPMAWSSYQVWHDPRGERPIGPESELTAVHLKRAVLQRLGSRRSGERITGLQVRCRADRVPPPRWSQETTTRHRVYRVLPWWQVRQQDYREL